MTSRTRGRSERTALIVGAALLPLGILVILLGWYGASHTPYVFEQVPYLISGGVLGLALVTAGGLLYFGYLLSRLIIEQREHTAELLQALHRIEARTGARRGAPVASVPDDELGI